MFRLQIAPKNHISQLALNPVSFFSSMVSHVLRYFDLGTHVLWEKISRVLSKLWFSIENHFFQGKKASKNSKAARIFFPFFFFWLAPWRPPPQVRWRPGALPRKFDGARRPDRLLGALYPLNKSSVMR